LLLEVQYLGVLDSLVENYIMRDDVGGRVELKGEVDGVRRDGCRLEGVMGLGIRDSHSLREGLEGK
jgi:hypothetical protein